MRLALLGIDEPAIELARAAARGGHGLEWFADADRASSPAVKLLAAAPRARPLDDWESLLTGQLADAVIVAATHDIELATERVRRLVQAGVSVLLTQPLGESPLIYYELEMIARESHAALAAFLPERNHPAILRMAEWASSPDSPLGRVEQCLVERQMSERVRRTVLAAFARDVGPISAVLGRIVRVGTLPAADEAAAFAALGVQMADATGRPIRWSVRPPDAGPTARLTLIGALGRASLQMPADGAWQLQLATGGAAQAATIDEFDPAASALTELAAAVAAHGPAPSWQAATQALELVEALARSVRTGRLVELRIDARTEQGNFKGVMSALGCSLLLGGLGILAVLAIFGEALGQIVGRVVFVGLLVTFAMFLVLQFLGRLAEPTARSGPSDDEPQ